MDVDSKRQSENASQREQLTLLWMQAQPIVAAFIKAAVRDQQHSEDLLQETALSAARFFDKYDSEKPFLPWAMAIARNKIADYYKGVGKNRLVFSLDTLSQLSSDFQKDGGVVHDYAESLQHCMDRLSKTPKIAIELRYVRSMSYAKIGERIGRSTAGVANLLLRTRAALLECIEARLEAEGQR